MTLLSARSERDSRRDDLSCAEVSASAEIVAQSEFIGGWNGHRFLFRGNGIRLARFRAT